MTKTTAHFSTWPKAVAAIKKLNTRKHAKFIHSIEYYEEEDHVVVVHFNTTRELTIANTKGLDHPTPT